MCHNNKDDNFCRRLTFGIILFLLLFMTVPLFGIYGAGKKYNEDISVTCNVIENYVVTNVCNRECNCTQIQCQQCSYICYDGYIAVKVDGITNRKSFKMIDLQKTAEITTRYLNDNYPLGYSFECYYVENVLQLYTTKAMDNNLLIPALVLIGLGVVAAFIWLIIECHVRGIPNRIQKSYSLCCEDIRRKRQIRIDEIKLQRKQREDQKNLFPRMEENV